MTAPNLLILVSDEHRRDAMGCMGHPIVRTPHLDALAARGAVFENAYTPSPICVPARAAIATGEPVHRTGHWDSAAPYAGRPRSWMHDLRDAGVEVVSIGKLHFSNADDDTGFSRQIIPMHVAGKGWTAGLIRQDPPPYDATAELARDVGPGDSSYTDYDARVTESAVDWLGDQARRERPWAAFVSLVSPHYPLRVPRRFHDLYDPPAMDMPIAHAPRERPRHPELINIARFFDYDRHFDAQRIREAKAAYYGLVSYMDDCVGRILSALAASGQSGRTLVLYVSDHGDMMGDHGLWTKQVMYEASAGVPMIMAGPGVAPGRRVRTAASLCDLAATACAAFALPSRGGGAPLAGLAAAPDDPDRTVFSEYHDGGSTTASFMVRWGRWKYVHHAGFAPQLFDLANDPQERQDRAGEHAFGDALAEGERRLRRICDPDAVNARCLADQRRRIEAFGGRDACLAGAFGHTPAPRGD